MPENSEPGKTVINCEPTIDISAARTLYEHLKNAISNKHNVEINAGDVTRVDAAILQIFIAFILESQSQGCSVKWGEVSDVFYASSRLLGIENILKLPTR